MSVKGSDVYALFVTSIFPQRAASLDYLLAMFRAIV